MFKESKVYTGSKGQDYITGNLKSVCDWFGLSYEYTRRVMKGKRGVVRLGVTITEGLQLKRKHKRKS